MKIQRTILFLLIAASLAVTSCRSRTDRSEGTVVLTAQNSGLLPVTVSVSSTTPGDFQVPSFDLHSILKDPTSVGGTDTQPEFQTIEMKSFTVTYRRRDTGTRLPTPIVRGLSGNVTPGGTLTVQNLPFLTFDQLLSQPLKDLVQLGRDTETGTAVIVLDVTFQFFGRTISGDDIASAPTTFTIDVTP
jgi:hypothetical protein